MPVQTRRQLATDPEMCMFALTIDYKASGYEEQETDEDQDCNFATKHDLLPKGLCSGKKVGSEKTAFLNVPLKEEVYVAKPAEGFVDPDNPRKASDFPKSPKTLDQPDALIRGKKALLGGIQFLVIKLIVDIDRWQSAQLRVLKPNAPMDVLSKRINSKSQHSGVILLVFTMTNGIHSSVIIPTTALRFRSNGGSSFSLFPWNCHLEAASISLSAKEETQWRGGRELLHHLVELVGSYILYPLSIMIECGIGFLGSSGDEFSVHSVVDRTFM
ncbi:hypothetical protein Tco_0478621 [Tanacetum coccineum]